MSKVSKSCILVGIAQTAALVRQAEEIAPEHGCGAEKKADYRTGYSEEKKQDVREKNADQHRTTRTG